MQIRCRRATPQDIARSWNLLEPDRPLFPARLWHALPDLLKHLLNLERILLCLLEDIDTGKIIFIGGSAFVQPDFLRYAIDRREGLLAAGFETEARGKAAFLNHKQIAAANRGRDLRLLNFFGVPERVDISDPNMLETVGSMTDAWNFFHRGFGLREIWCDFVVPEMIEFMVRIGLRIEQERTAANGQRAVLLRFTREQALESTPAWPGSAMLSPPPRLGFTRGEQKLLELALLDSSDRDAAEQLKLSTEAVKKRWRSVYAKVARIDPALLRTDVNGADQRRALLQSLRNNLQELRPYSA